MLILFSLVSKICTDGRPSSMTTLKGPSALRNGFVSDHCHYVGSHHALIHIHDMMTEMLVAGSIKAP
jgi:hypothetical protein